MHSIFSFSRILKGTGNLGFYSPVRFLIHEIWTKVKNGLFDKNVPIPGRWVNQWFLAKSLWHCRTVMQVRCQTIFLWTAKNDLFILICRELQSSWAESQSARLSWQATGGTTSWEQTRRAVCAEEVAANRAMELACMWQKQCTVDRRALTSGKRKSCGGLSYRCGEHYAYVSMRCKRPGC